MIFLLLASAFCGKTDLEKGKATKKAEAKMSDIVREPSQQRSIAKKNKIIEAGYALFAEKGYYSTNTAEIAKRAGVSTGIVYGYFRDKRDILVDVLEIYIKNVFSPVFDMLEKMTAPIDFEHVLTHVVDVIVDVHKRNSAIHETLHSLAPTDKGINERFLELEEEMTGKMVAGLKKLGYCRDDLAERVHLAMETVQSYAHECVYDRHSYIDYSSMREIVIKMLLTLFE